MNKQEAAEFLGISIRALERYVQQGKISVRYEKGKTRPTANFEPSELEAFKKELNQPTIKPAIETRQIPTEPQSQTANLTYNSGDITRFDEIGDISEFGEVGVVEKLSSIIELLLAKDDNQPIVPIADKLLLTLPEAQALTGLSKEVLRGAIASGELKAKLIGKSWRVKRSDLEAYVDQLF